ncbi:hypothetical protein GCM10009609_27040 [Pseudonocardia aurantiaca]|uniref:Uncharacterized protein n=1 Tax=Pseudonocardia aurantiaca TaxID=75290 RepID=A0ABW4FIB3_9PSEU
MATRPAFARGGGTIMVAKMEERTRANVRLLAINAPRWRREGATAVAAEVSLEAETPGEG